MTATAEARALADRMGAFAQELLEPLTCTTPAGNPEPGMHCAACCYGSGLLIAGPEDQAIVDAALALLVAARIVEFGP